MLRNVRAAEDTCSLQKKLDIARVRRGQQQSAPQSQHAEELAQRSIDPIGRQMLNELAGNDRIKTIRRRRDRLGEVANARVVNFRVECLHPLRHAIQSGDTQAGPKRFHHNPAPAGVAADIQYGVRIVRQMTDKLLVAPFREWINFADLLAAVQLNNFGKARHRKDAPNISSLKRPDFYSSCITKDFTDQAAFETTHSTIS